MDSLGKRIKAARKNKKLSQAALGEHCNGLSRSAVAQWEADLTVPTGPNLVAVAEILSVSTRWLVHGGDQGGPVIGPARTSFSENDLINKELMGFVIASAFSYVQVHRLADEIGEVGEIVMEIYEDAKENLMAGSHSNPLVAATVSAKAILRTLK